MVGDWMGMHGRTEERTDVWTDGRTECDPSWGYGASTPFGADAPSPLHYLHPSTEVGHRVPMTTNAGASILICTMHKKTYTFLPFPAPLNNVLRKKNPKKLWPPNAAILTSFPFFKITNLLFLTSFLFFIFVSDFPCQ